MQVSGLSWNVQCARYWECNTQWSWKRYLWHEWNPKVSTLQWSRTWNECQHADYMSVHGKKFIARKCCSGSIFFWCCCLTRCLQSLSSTRWLWYGLGNGTREARRVSRDVTPHTLSAHSTRLVITARPWTAVCIMPWKMKTTWRTIHELTPFHPVCCCRHVSKRTVSIVTEPILRPWKRSNGCFTTIYRSANWSIHDASRCAIYIVNGIGLRGECQWGRRRRRRSNVHGSPTFQERLCFCLTRGVSNARLRDEGWIRVNNHESKWGDHHLPKSRRNKSTRGCERDA